METENAWGSWSKDDFVDDDAKSQPILESDPWSVNEQQNPAPKKLGAKGTESDFSAKNGVTLSESWDLGEYSEDERPADFGQSLSNESIESSWDEPEPNVDAASDLSELLYPPDDTVTDISIELKIGEFLTAIGPINDGQRVKCVELMKACRVRRLRYILPWLEKNQWSIHALQLFFEFREFWETGPNTHWWETFLWSEREQCWMPRYQREMLTLDHAYALVRNRSHCAAREVIDEKWFGEWEEFAVWETGVRSFASFASLRASVTATQDWRDYIFPQDRRGAMEIAECKDDTFAPFMLPSISEQYGFPTTHSGREAPWPDVSERAERIAASFGGDLLRAWQIAVSELASE